METIAGGKRSEEDFPRAELRHLTLDEALRCLKASAPDVGSNYNKADTLGQPSAPDKDENSTNLRDRNRDD